MLKIDSREPEKIFKIFNELKIEFTKECLDVGDFFDERTNCIFERKTISDFCQSMMKGHMQKQLLDLENYNRKYLILVGNSNEVTQDEYLHLTKEQYLGMLASISVRTNIKILNVNTDYELARLIVKICEKTDDGKILSIHNTELMKHKVTDKDIELMQISCLPGIGLDKAKKVLDKFSCRQLYDVSVEELCEIDGIGPKIAEKIKSIYK